MQGNASWHLRVLGRPALVSTDGREVRLRGKALGVLAYLALEGPTSRSRMAGLLWPDSPEATARNNLVHVLRRLSQAAGADLVDARETLRLAPEVSADVPPLAAGDHAFVDLPEGALLDGVEFDEDADLADWLLTRRERLLELRARALERAAREAEDAGQLSGALKLAQRLIDLDPLSEEGHRRLMRLHYLSGDRAAALHAFHRCQEVLRRELGTEPLPETLALAAEIERGGALPAPPARPAPIPLSVLRPPRLVGREAQWAALEAAWRAGQFIMVSGEPGVGKSRLTRDFAASKGEVLLLEGRPGDVAVPYSTAARNVRRILERRPDALERLPPWVGPALSGLLPELDVPAGSGGEARLHEAIALVFAAGMEGAAAIVYDDIQFADESSISVGLFLVSAGFPLGREGGVPHLLCCYRRGELSEFTAEVFSRLEDADQGARIEVEPLAAAEVGVLLRDLNLKGLPDTLAAQLPRFTGGNPLFVLETLKHLLEDGSSADGTLPVPQKVGQLITRRLERLPTSAVQAARAAAVLQSDFNVELVADVLGAPLLDVAASWEELEAAQIVTGERFSHDLVYEAVRSAIPDGVRGLLHRSAARASARHGGHPARVARHWQEGGRPREAARMFAQAAEAALTAGRPAEAREYAAQAERAVGSEVLPELLALSARLAPS